jgi:acyl carrier protein
MREELIVNRDELVALVVKELRAALPLEDRPVVEADLLRELPDIDSLRLARIASALEQSTGVEFDDEVLFGAKTVGDLVDALEKMPRTVA